MESSSSQPGMTLVPRGCLTMSGDITDFHNGGREEGASGILCVEGRSAAKHPTVLSTPKNDPGPSVSMPGGGTLA